MAPVNYPSLYAGDEDGKVTASAAMWGLPGDPAEQITMTRYYAAQRTFWVDPVSGTIVKEAEHANHYFSRDALKPEVTLAEYKVTSTADTVESQVNSARDERDRLCALVAGAADHVHRDRPDRAGRRRTAGLVQPAHRERADRPRPGPRRRGLRPTAGPRNRCRVPKP